MLDKDLVHALDDLLARAFAEDGEDVTSLAVFGPSARVAGTIVCREPAVVAGVAFLPRLFRFLSPPARAVPRVEDGTRIAPGTVLADVDGPAITVLAAERIALNLLQRLSGIATLTAKFVSAVEGTGARVLDTRKTTPGLRLFERYAVRCGGGENHRFGLAHAFLVKDNHADGCGSVWDATRRVVDFRSINPVLQRHLLEVEARTVDEVHDALDAGAERILLDNMSVPAMKQAVKDVRLFEEATGIRVGLEASGRMDPKKARETARAGVDFISAGALTHSVTAVDIALDVHVAPSHVRALAGRPRRAASRRKVRR